MDWGLTKAREERTSRVAMEIMRLNMIVGLRGRSSVSF